MAVERAFPHQVPRHDDQFFACRDLVKALFYRRRQRQFVGALKYKDRLGVRVGQVIGDLARFKEHIERHDRGSGLHNAVIHYRKERQIRAAESDLVAVADTHFDQGVRHAVRESVDLTVCEADIAPNDRLFSRSKPCVVRYYRRQIKGGSRILHFVTDAGEI